MGSFLRGAAVAVLIAAPLAACGGTSSSTSRGRPGIEVVWRADTAPGASVGSSDLERAAKVIRARLAGLGRTGTVSVRPESHELVVRVDGSTLGAVAGRLLFSQHTLDIYDLEPAATGPSLANAQGNIGRTPSLYDLLAGQQAKAKRTKPAPTAYYLFDPRKRLRAGPAPSVNGPNGLLTSTDLLTSTRRSTVKFHGTLPSGFRAFAVPGDTVVISCGPPSIVCPAGDGPVPPTQTSYYLFKHDLANPDPQQRFPQLTGSDLELSATTADLDPTTGQPEVLMSFTSQGGRVFRRITRAEYRRGKAVGNPQHFAIVLDDQIMSFPQIDPTDSSLANGIDPVNGARITGLPSAHEAENLARALKAGTLPLHFVIVSRRVVR